MMPTPEATTGLLRAALSEGVCQFDTAPAYGEAEARLGLALGAEGAVWTKLDHRLEPGSELPAQAVASLEGSLRRLRRRRLDLLQWHNWNARLAEDPHFQAGWKELARDPRVTALGASTYGAEDALAAVASGAFSVVQVEWNLLNQRVLRALASTASGKGVRIAVRSVFLQGVLTAKGEALPPHLRKLAEPRSRAARLAASLGFDLSALALRAALEHPDVDFVLVGVDAMEQLEGALTVARGAGLPPDCWPDLESLEVADSRIADPRYWVEQ